MSVGAGVRILATFFRKVALFFHPQLLDTWASDESWTTFPAGGESWSD